jgi:hypothetical protein
MTHLGRVHSLKPAMPRKLAVPRKSIKDAKMAWWALQRTCQRFQEVMAFLPIIPIPKGGKGKRGRDHVNDARNVRQKSWNKDGKS